MKSLLQESLALAIRWNFERVAKLDLLPELDALEHRQADQVLTRSLQYALMRSNLDAISTPPVSQILPQGLTLSTTSLQVRRESQRVAPGLLWAAAGQRSPAAEA